MPFFDNPQCRRSATVRLRLYAWRMTRTCSFIPVFQGCSVRPKCRFQYCAACLQLINFFSYFSFLLSYP
jgi:hypothetical protein